MRELPFPNVFAAPLKLWEILAGFILLGALQASIAFAYISLLAALLFALNVWTLGFHLIPLFLNLLFFGWVIGLFTIGILLRFGPSAEMFAFFSWMLKLAKRRGLIARLVTD